MNERELIRKVRKGDREAFGEVVMKYRDLLIAYGFRLTGSIDAAKDLMQEAFFRFYQNLDSIDERQSLKNWLFRVVTNLAIDSWRKRRREVQLDWNLEDIEVVFEPEDEEVQRLNDCVKKLPIRQRTAVVLFYAEGYSVKEIAEIMGCSEGTVKAHLFKGRENLRRCMGGERQ